MLPKEAMYEGAGYKTDGAANCDCVGLWWGKAKDVIKDRMREDCESAKAAMGVAVRRKTLEGRMLPRAVVCGKTAKGEHCLKVAACNQIIEGRRLGEIAKVRRMPHGPCAKGL